MGAVRGEVLLLAGLAVGGALLFQRLGSGSGSSWAANAGKNIGSGAVDLVSGVLSGVADNIPDTVNPASRDNVIYQAVSAPFGGSLGGAIYDFFH